MPRDTCSGAADPSIGLRVFGRARHVAAPRGQRGVVLVFFALFFLALFGLFAVVVDLGIARATQLQMQTSADAAALEGLQARDSVPGDAAASDLSRRILAAATAAAVFDEDGDPATGPNRFRLGAGLVLDTGVGGVNDPAGGVLTAGAPWVPGLQLNVDGNLASGDLVAGSFTALDAAAPGRVDWHVEANDYTREDFVPDGAGLAFLARLRRTRESSPLDRVPGVSSAGPTLPYLFGLGSGALTTPDPDIYDPRRDGITVRAAAIADARRVTAAGLARPGLPGLAPLALDAAAGDVRWLSLDELNWIALGEGEPFSLTLDASGAVTGTVTGAAVHGSPRLGAFMVEGPVLIPAAPTPELAGLVYASLHLRDGGTGAARIRGFVALSIESAAIGPVGTLVMNGVKLGPTVAPRNASAQPAAAFSLAFGSPPPAGPSLLAPVLAR